MSIEQLAIYVVIIGAIVALVFIALRQFNLAIPAWVIQVFWVLVVAAVVIFAIKLLIGPIALGLR